jgi:oxygen-independent coproporphyrinogen-3 oxidase
MTTAYAHALADELRFLAEAQDESVPIHTVFFGGGTPSLLSLPELDIIFSAIHTYLDVLPDAEITLEVNPGTVDLAYLQGLKALGVNRISMGVQSAHPQDLAILEREHGYADAIQAVDATRRAGIARFSVDLIFGVPYQSMERWQHNLELALALGPEHISLYNLSIEHGTPLEAMLNKGLLAPPDADLAADMYEWTIDYLAAHEFVHYEVSNWARRDAQGNVLSSKHNQQYWRNLPYFGFGAGAHGYAGGYRTMNALAPAAYIQRIKDGQARAFPRTPATVNAAHIDQARDMGETMMMGLRLLNEGVSDEAFKTRYGQGIEDAYPEAVPALRGRGLLNWSENGGGRDLRLTERGLMLGNQVFMEFV